METLTQCWFTRIHLPDRHRHREEDGSCTGTCRYCHRRLVSWHKGAWALADGLNVSRLAEISGRYLTLYDHAADFVVHRYAVAHLNDEQAIDAFKAALSAEYGLADDDTTLELRDSAASHRRRPVRRLMHRKVRKVSRPALDTLRSA